MSIRMTKCQWGAVEVQPVWLFDLEGDGLRASVSNYGGVIQSLRGLGEGRDMDVVLGYDSLEEYRRSDTFFGAMIGPLADRVAGGTCTLDGRTARLPQGACPSARRPDQVP